MALPPLPHTTPHTLRRTYISIVLLANSFDVKWVMSQVGHADSKMTMDVYAQLEQRAKRSHGTNFYQLIRDARNQIEDAATTPVTTQKAPKPNRARFQARRARGQELKKRSSAGQKRHGETGIRTRDTTIFSGGLTEPTGGAMSPKTRRFAGLLRRRHLRLNARGATRYR